MIFSGSLNPSEVGLPLSEVRSAKIPLNEDGLTLTEDNLIPTEDSLADLLVLTNSICLYTL